MSNKDRKGLPALMILLSELSAFLWILSSFLLSIDTDQDFDFFGSFATKLLIWIQYIFWVFNHIFELILAFLCFVPPADTDTFLTDSPANKSGRTRKSKDSESKKVKDSSREQSNKKETEIVAGKDEKS
jgi:hypothetical protein